MKANKLNDEESADAKSAKLGEEVLAMIHAMLQENPDVREP